MDYGNITGRFIKLPASLIKVPIQNKDAKASKKQPGIIEFPTQGRGAVILPKHDESDTTSSHSTRKPCEPKAKLQNSFLSLEFPVLGGRSQHEITGTGTSQTQSFPTNFSENMSSMLEDNAGDVVRHEDVLANQRQAKISPCQQDETSIATKKPRLMEFRARRATMASLDEVEATSNSHFMNSMPLMKPQRHTMALRHHPSPDSAFATIKVQTR